VAHGAGGGAPPPSENAPPARPAAPRCWSGGAGQPAFRPATAPGASRSRLPAEPVGGWDSGGGGSTATASPKSPPATMSTDGKCTGSGDEGRLVVGGVPSGDGVRLVVGGVTIGGGVPSASRAPNGGRSPHHFPSSKGSGEAQLLAHSRRWSSSPGSAAAMASSVGQTGV